MAKAQAHDIIVSDKIMADLKRRYAEPWRHYHTWQGHIMPCLRLYHILRRRLIITPSAQEELLLAILFHYAVFDPHRAKERNGAWNKTASAALAQTILKEHGYSPEVVNDVSMLIMSTVPFAHVDIHSPGALLICDIDLAILGAEPRDYDAYADAIRKEYGFAPDEIYGQERISVLRRFLSSDHIFRTRQFNQSHETQARENLTRELRSLEKA
jgi:predicted metal-dependent HD superfamily phosphohydrolase